MTIKLKLLGFILLVSILVSCSDSSSEKIRAISRSLAQVSELRPCTAIRTNIPIVPSRFRSNAFLTRAYSVISHQLPVLNPKTGLHLAHNVSQAFLVSKGEPIRQPGIQAQFRLGNRRNSVALILERGRETHLSSYYELVLGAGSGELEGPSGESKKKGVLFSYRFRKRGSGKTLKQIVIPELSLTARYELQVQAISTPTTSRLIGNLLIYRKGRKLCVTGIQAPLLKPILAPLRAGVVLYQPPASNNLTLEGIQLYQ